MNYNELQKTRLSHNTENKIAFPELVNSGFLLAKKKCRDPS